jgi:hypothetical protein
MKRRRKWACDHPRASGLPQQYAEVLRLRHQVLLAETDQDAASQPSDPRRADAAEASASGSCAGSAPYSEQVK